MNQQSNPVVVLGAGAVGICSAAYLQQAGHRVVVIDRALPAQGGASFGNAACLNSSSIVPVAMPGVLAKVPGWLLQPDGPLVLRWSYLPRMLPWLSRFVRSSRPEAVAAQAAALRRLLAPSVETYMALARDADALDLIRDGGNLLVYSTQEGYEGDRRAIQLRMDNGVAMESLDAGALRELDPNLAPMFTRGYYIRENGYLRDPGVFLARVAARLAERGVEFRRGEVIGLRTNGASVSEVVTRDGAQAASAVVVALGAWSAPLARELGDPVLLDTERGYHVEVAGMGGGPAVPAMWGEGKVVTTPLQGRVRCAGTVELAGLQAPPDWGRTALLGKLLGRMYPALAPAFEGATGATVSRWLGFRPSTPDSLPVIGRSRRYANAVYAFGHGHVGLTAGAPTGRLVAQLVSSETPAIDLAPYSISRFR